MISWSTSIRTYLSRLDYKPDTLTSWMPVDHKISAPYKKFKGLLHLMLQISCSTKDEN